MKPSRIVGRGSHAVASNCCVCGSGYFSLTVALAATDKSRHKLSRGEVKITGVHLIRGFELCTHPPDIYEAFSHSGKGCTRRSICHEHGDREHTPRRPISSTAEYSEYSGVLNYSTSGGLLLSLTQRRGMSLSAATQLNPE